MVERWLQHGSGIFIRVIRRPAACVSGPNSSVQVAVGHTLQTDYFCYVLFDKRFACPSIAGVQP